MNITVTDLNASSNYIESNNLIQSLLWKKFTRVLIIYGFIAVALIVYEIIFFNDWTWRFVHGKETTYYNLHLGLGAGITIFLFILGTLRKSLNERYKFSLNLKEKAKRYFSSSDKQVIILNEKLIWLENTIVKNQYDWLVITSYMLIDNYIYLIKDSSISTAIIINKSLLSENDYSDLMNFLNLTKPETKDIYKAI